VLTSAIADPAAPQRTKACRTVLMVGTHRNAMGGISSVVRGYENAGLFDHFKCVYVTTHRDGSAWVKAWTACTGWITTALYLTKLTAPVVHIHLSSRASFWRKAGVCLLSLGWRRPYILHVHGSEFMVFHDNECGPAARRFVRWIFAASALVIALSPEWRASLLGVCPEAKIVVLPNAVLLPDVTKVAEIRSYERSILSLGRLGRRKGSFDLVQAFARVAARFPEWKLICAGDGAVTEVRAMVAEAGLQDRIICPGWLDCERTQSALAAASIFALPSYAEGIPMALLEAMSWKLPVITSPVGGIPQVVSHGRNGRLVKPGDIDGLAASLSLLMADEGERKRLGTAARATIESEFSQDEMMRRLAEIYTHFGVQPRS
jgi:glycosyltransferase involved in cell wall biosynthesis